MEACDNPYSPGAGTPPPKLAGRDEILQYAEDAILRAKGKKAAKSLMLRGLRGVGKTVLLNRIKWVAEHAECRTAMFEASAGKSLAKQIAPQLHQLLHRLGRGKNLSGQVDRAIRMLWDLTVRFNVNFDFEPAVTVKRGWQDKTTGDLETDLTKLFVAIGEASQSHGTVSVLLVDEVQFLSKKDSEALVAALHEITRHSLPLLMFGAGLPQPAGTAGGAKPCEEGRFECREIGNLDGGSARQALVEPAKRQNVDYDDGAVRTILEATKGYPYFLQLWGFHAWEAASASPITDEDAQEATRRATAELNEGFFRARLDHLGNRQRDYAWAMADAMAEQEPGSLIVTTKEVADILEISLSDARAIRRGVIEKGLAYSPGHGQIAFTAPRFDKFMLHAWGGPKHSKRKARPNIYRRSKKKIA